MPSIFAPIIVDSFHCFFDDSSPSWSNRWTVLLKRAQSDCREKRGWNTDIIHNANSNSAVRSVLEVYNSIIISKACVNWNPTHLHEKLKVLFTENNEFYFMCPRLYNITIFMNVIFNLLNLYEKLKWVTIFSHISLFFIYLLHIILLNKLKNIVINY